MSAQCGLVTTPASYLYTESWSGNQNDHLSHEYTDLYEAWQVQRFIALAYAK
jgi:hypothetical protein